MDWVFIDLETEGGTLLPSIFNWGDGNPANNGSLGAVSPELDNYPAAGSPTAQIIIPVNGTYRYIHLGSNDCPGMGGAGDDADVSSLLVYP